MPTITVRPRLYGYVGHLGQDNPPDDITPTNEPIPIDPTIDSSTVPGQLSPITQTYTTQTGNLIQNYGVTADGQVIDMGSTAYAPTTTPNTTVTSTITPSSGPTVSSMPSAMSAALQNPMMWMEESTIMPGMANWQVIALAGGAALVLGMMMRKKK
jgi:hypothetical protein